MSSRVRNDRTRRGVALGYRSGLEREVAGQLRAAGIEADYEAVRIRYVAPETVHHYTPDFVLPNGIIIETKGRFLASDRQKHLLIRQQRPDLDIRFVFTSSRAKIASGSKTTLAAWCDKHGFLFAERRIPEAWLTE